jgi:hypothetical protein
MMAKHNNLVLNNILFIKRKCFLNLNSIFTTHNYNLCIRSTKSKFFILFNYINKYLWKITLLRNLISKFNLYKTIFFFFKKIFVKTNELELKGVNYRCSKYDSTLLLDIGKSHIQMLFFFKKKFFITLKKKKMKKFFFLNFNTSTLTSSLFYFWYKIKSVGPYKLKGFQFLNERLKLKEGKKPFK